MSDPVHVNSSNSGSGSTNLTSVAPSSGSGPKLNTSLKIAILLNSYRSPFISDIRESYVRSIGAVAPDSILTFFYPAEHIPVSTTSSTTSTSTFTSTGSVVGPVSGPGPGLGLGLGLGTIHGGYGGHGYGHAPPPVHVHGSETGGHREHHRGGYEYEYRFNDLPDPSSFDLIVIGGGNADPRKTHGWILRVHRFIRDVVANYPSTKLCGICWGHQTISLLFGGEIVDMGMPELGVTEAKLTPLGRRFLPRMADGAGVVRLQQHHRRAVGRAPNGFHELLAGNQAFLSHNNAILTFQGHPEKDARAAKVRIRDAARWFGTDMTDQRAVADLVRQMEVQHDGLEVWKRVLQWAEEGVMPVGRQDLPKF